MKNQLISQLTWRAAIKKFDVSKKLSKKQVDELLEAANLAPSSYGLQPFKFYVVSDDKVKEQLAKHGEYNRSQLTTASHLVIFAAKVKMSVDDVEKYTQLTKKVRKLNDHQTDAVRMGFLGFVEQADDDTLKYWAIRQTYIPLGVMVVAAALCQIDVSPFEGFDKVGFNQVLGADKEGYNVQAVLALGYRSDEDTYSKMAKVRRPITDIVKWVK